MKRRQNYRVSIMHRAIIKIDVIATSQKEAALCAIVAFEHGEQLENDFVNLSPVVDKIECRGAVKEKKNAVI